MKRLALFVLAAALAVLAMRQDALPYARDIDDLELMRIMGIDVGETMKNGIKVTMAGGDQSAGQGGESWPTVVLSQEGESLSKACTDLKSFGETFIFFGHVTQCLVGEAAAEGGLVRLLDYYERNVELRLSAPLFIVKGSTAAQMIQEGTGGGEGTIIKRLESIETDIRLRSDTSRRTVKEILAQLSENGCALVPALTLEESPASDEEEEVEKTIQTDGYAVFRENRLTGFLTPQLAWGANFLLEEIYGGILELDLADGTMAALQMLGSSCEWKPEFQDGTLVGLTASVLAEGAISELQGSADPLVRADLEEMEALAGEKIAELICQVLEISQKENADFLHLERTIGVLRPDRWYDLQENWDEIFPQLPIQVEVEVELRRTFDVNQSLEGGRT